MAVIIRYYQDKIGRVSIKQAWVGIIDNKIDQSNLGFFPLQDGQKGQSKYSEDPNKAQLLWLETKTKIK